MWDLLFNVRNICILRISVECKPINMSWKICACAKLFCRVYVIAKESYEPSKHQLLYYSKLSTHLLTLSCSVLLFLYTIREQTDICRIEKCFYHLMSCPTINVDVGFHPQPNTNWSLVTPLFTTNSSYYLFSAVHRKAENRCLLTQNKTWLVSFVVR